MDRAAILAIYAQGPEAVVTLVLALVDQMRLLSDQVAALDARVAELEAQLARERTRDSHNSHQPPSTDQTRRPPPTSLRERSGKRPGGQPGHPGATLEWCATPEAVVPHAPPACAACGAPLAGAAAAAAVSERRQVYDLPPLRLHVTEHQTRTARCAQCGHWTTGTFPAGVTSTVQYGPGVQALSVYLQVQQLLPVQRTSELLAALVGQPISPGTLSRAVEQCATTLAPVEAHIRAGLAQAPVLHLDETGCFVATKRWWLHTASTPTLTRYTVHPKRGRAAHEAIGLLPDYGGTAVHDGYSSYFTYRCTHALCGVHLLRDLKGLAEAGERWAAKLARCLRAMKAAVARAVAKGQTALAPHRRRRYERRYAALVAEGERAHPPPPPTGRRGRRARTAAGNLLARLRQHQAAVLRFLADFAVPFDNNDAERDLRMTKVKQKISGGFRTPQGAARFATIRGYLQTARKQGQQALEVLRGVFDGHPFIPAVPE